MVPVNKRSQGSMEMPVFSCMEAYWAEARLNGQDQACRQNRKIQNRRMEAYAKEEDLVWTPRIRLLAR